MFSSHQLDVVERLADNLVIISGARMCEQSILCTGSRVTLRDALRRG